MVSSTAAPWCRATVESRTGTPGTGVITVPVLATWKTETTPIWVGGEPMSSLILKRAKVSRPSGQWRDDDYDVICKGAMVGRVFLSPAVPQDRRDVDAGPRLSRRPYADARIRADSRSRDGRVRRELAPLSNAQATSSFWRL
jgi:hypothetical protein